MDIATHNIGGIEPEVLKHRPNHRKERSRRGLRFLVQGPTGCVARSTNKDA